jgi:CRISPR-associated endonuclease Csy4
MKRYYLMVTFIPKEANLELLMGRCVSIMHDYICKYAIQGMGISLPTWSNDSIGNVIAFIHTDASILNKLSKNNYFQDMNEVGFFKLSDVNPVPDNCGEVRFIRNQNVAKKFVGEARRRLKRLKKRAIARGGEFNPIKSSFSRGFDAFHRIPASSRSSEQDYILHIQKEISVLRVEPNFNRYGFATNIEYQGTVPDLSQYTVVDSL